MVFYMAPNLATMRSPNLVRFLALTAILLAATSIIALAYLSPMHDWDEVRISQRLGVLERTVTALEKAIDHLFAVGDNINVDGVFGVRLLEDQLLAFLKQIASRGVSKTQDPPFNNVLPRLTSLQNKAKKFRKVFTKVAERNDPTYYRRTRYLVYGSSWDMWYPARDVNRQLMPNYAFDMVVKETLSENSSDACLKEASENQCRFSEACWDLMAAPSYHGYSLTHEILFILNAFAVGCVREIELDVQKYKQLDTDQLLAQECATVLHEAELIAGRDYPVYRRDLFMEQAAICGILGYRDFFRDEWLAKILSWQTDGGCYTSNTTFSREQYFKDFPPEPRRRRRKREERPLAEGCMSHVTAVAVAALGQYVRFLLEPLLEDGYFT